MSSAFSYSPVSTLLPDADRRWRSLSALASLALFCLPALVIAVPANLLPFGLLLLFTSVLGADYLWRARAAAGTVLSTTTLLMVAVIGMSVWSVWQFDLGWRDIDNRSRFLVMPWALLWVCALRPRASMLWWGAVVGLVAVLVLAIAEVIGGAERASAWTNAIVLADIALMLMIVVVFCRPPSQVAWVVLGLAAGVAVIVLSGSRGAWIPLGVLLLVMVMALQWGSLKTRWLTLLGAVLLGTGAVMVVPGASQQLRLDELRSDMQRIEQGDVNSSAGARLERLQVAWDTFLERPWSGVGIGHFDDAMKRLPVCRQEQVAVERCHLDHAHNDLAEWGATQGVPGVLLLLAVYGVPLGLFVWLFRRSGKRQFRGPAAAGVMVVLAYVLCGLTQSMFAHQITASFYVCIVGVLAGFSVQSMAQPRAGDAPQSDAGSATA